MTGESYVWKWRDKLGFPKELWPVPTSWVNPMFSDEGHIVAYEVFQGYQRQRITVPPQDMFRSIIPDPTNLIRGLGPTQAATREIQAEEERADYVIEMTTNLRTPGTIVNQPEGWSPEEKDEVRAILNQGLGRGRRGRTVFLEGQGATIQQSSPLKDLDWEGYANLAETRITSGYGVPAILLGLRSGLQNGTYSNYETAEHAFYRGTMVPTWRQADESLTDGLLRAEGETDENVCVYHDLKEVRNLQEDEEEISQRAEREWKAGMIMLDEARKMTGKPALPNGRGQVYFLPLGGTVVPADQLAAPQAEPPSDTGAALQDETALDAPDAEKPPLDQPTDDGPKPQAGQGRELPGTAAANNQGPG